MPGTQIQLTEEQHRLLRVAAQRMGVSIEEMARRCVVRVIREESPQQRGPYARAADLVGTFEDPDGGAADLSERHDEYLDEAFRESRLPRHPRDLRPPDPHRPGS